VPGFSETVRYNFTLEYVESSTSFSSLKSAWKSFTHVIETEDSLLFWVGEILVFFIPKTSLPNVKPDEQLRELLITKGLIV